MKYFKKVYEKGKRLNGIVPAGLVPCVTGGHFIFLIENAKNIIFVSLILLIITTIDPKKYWATSQTFFLVFERDTNFGHVPLSRTGMISYQWFEIKPVGGMNSNHSNPRGNV